MEEFLILALGITLGFFIQTVAGFSAALFALPLMLFALELQESIAIIAVLLFVFSVIELYRNWKLIDRKIFWELIAWTIIGTVIGVYSLKYGNQVLMKRILGVFVLCYASYSLLKRRRITVLKRYGSIFGFSGGFFSGAYASGGSIYAVYINNKLKKADNIRATLIGILAINNFLRAPLLAYNNILTWSLLLKSLYLLPFFLLALYLGHKAYDRMNDKLFRNAVLILLLFSGLSLIFR